MCYDAIKNWSVELSMDRDVLSADYYVIKCKLMLTRRI